MNIKIFNNDIPADLKLDNEEVVALDCEALGLVLRRSSYFDSNWFEVKRLLYN